MEKRHILVVEDNAKLAHLFDQALCERFDVSVAGSLQEARSLLSGIHGAVVDLQLPDGEGITLIPEMKRRNPGCIVVVVTAYGTIPKAVEAVKLGAHTFLEKPVDLDALLELFTDRLDPASAGDPVWVSQAMSRVISLSERVAPTPFPVLITGETGTGKEVLARYVHNKSGRTHFVGVNCANLTDELADSILFGHVKGAFTGAVEAREGLVAAADGGTLFLDEVGDLPLAVQPKLLRFLDSGRYLPLGCTQERHSAARVIAATNINLENAVKQGTFREDLFFRLSCFPLHIPPLRERREDILPLAQHHLRQLEQKLSLVGSLSPCASDALVRLPLSGNIRELFNILDRAVVLSKGLITAEIIQDLTADGPKWDDPEEATDFWEASRQGATMRERELITAALQAAGGNKSQAARVLNISYKTLLNKMKRMGL
ncbi:MAG: sigma-54 dependent transcriptional regulator [Deltaproteobacteria bacterium]